MPLRYEEESDQTVEQQLCAGTGVLPSLDELAVRLHAVALDTPPVGWVPRA